MADEEIVHSLIRLLGERDAWTMRITEALEASTDELAGLRATLLLLVDVLTARGDLTTGHPRLAERTLRQKRAQPPRVRLTVISDKHAVPNSDVDCPSLMHLCNGRCCTYSVELSATDVEEARLKWKIDEPYMLRREPDGYCTHLERGTMGCLVYEDRPATCRRYDCRQDKRVWLDWEQKIPAPMPVGMVGLVPTSARKG